MTRATEEITSWEEMDASIKDTTIDTFDLDREHVERVIAKIEDLIRKGMMRRVVVKSASGEIVIERRD